MNMSPPSVSNTELQQLSLMSQLSDIQLNTVQKTMKTIHLAAGEHLFEHGDKAEKFYLVKSGQIKLFRISMDGCERIIDIIQPGQMFSEYFLFLENGKYPLGAEALTKSELLSFDSKTFKSVLEDSKETCYQLMSDMSQCLHQYLDQVDYLTLQNASFRLVNYLLQQIPDNHHLDDSYILQLPTTKNIIASRLSIQPETLSRILRSLKNRKLIEVNGKVITIHSVNQLKQVAA